MLFSRPFGYCPDGQSGNLAEQLATYPPCAHFGETSSDEPSFSRETGSSSRHFRHSLSTSAIYLFRLEHDSGRIEIEIEKDT
jgi:hypothetical protein